VPIEEVIRRRISVRTFADQPLDKIILGKIDDVLSSLDNPFQIPVTIRRIESGLAENGAKLGTYGVIRGAGHFLGAAAAEGDLALEGLGYGFEKLLLYLTSLGLGTCWLGGTFKKSEFAKAMAMPEGQLFPVVSPFGLAAEKRSLADILVRRIARGDTRKSWPELFFRGDFSSPLAAEEAGDYRAVLEMVRLAPSASNKQPWRIVRDGNHFHFYQQQTPGYSKTFGYDIQRIDMGIAACHFHLTAREKGMPGKFIKIPSPLPGAPENTHYVFTWMAE